MTRRVTAPVLVALFVPLFSCAPRPESHTSVSAAFEVLGDQEQDVVWAVRTIQVPRRANSGAIEYTQQQGLLACYRTSAPGFPECYLAKVSSDNSNLVWPNANTDFAIPGAHQPSGGMAPPVRAQAAKHEQKSDPPTPPVVAFTCDETCANLLSFSAKAADAEQERSRCMTECGQWSAQLRNCIANAKSFGEVKQCNRGTR